MKVLHLSHTPLVGAPGRVCKALALHPGVSARWAVLDAGGGAYQTLNFDLDLCWATDREEIIDLAGEADVIHLHNYLDLKSTAFAPVDFNRLWRSGKAIVRQFHSTPDLIARFLRVGVQAVLDCPLPKLVIAQYPERFFPNALLVPNIPLVEQKNCGASGSAAVRVGYAPSRFNSARSARWDTKGYKETVRVLNELRRSCRRRGYAIEIDIIEQVPHHECLIRKSRCDIILDDLVTGSYHLNTLESLAQGSVCLSYLDQRSTRALFDLLGRSDFPVINVGLEDVVTVLTHLVGERELVRCLGEESGRWMEEHWEPKKMATYFLDAYRRAAADPAEPFPLRFDPSRPSDRWTNIGLHDLIWENRSNRWPSVKVDELKERVLGPAIHRLKRILSH